MLLVHRCMLPHDQRTKDCNEQKPYSDGAARMDLWYGGREIEEKIQVLRVDTTMLFNSIGGAMGLFMGFSLLSLCNMVLDGTSWVMRKINRKHQLRH